MSKRVYIFPQIKNEVKKLKKDVNPWAKRTKVEMEKGKTEAKRFYKLRENRKQMGCYALNCVPQNSYVEA